MLLLNAPYFEGVSSVDADVPGLFPVAIAGHPYKIELREYERSTLDVIRQQADQSNVPSERSFNPYALWRRSLETWHHGAGQDNIDLQDESDPARFRSSKGIDPWTRGQIGLLPDTDEKLDSGATNLKMAVAGLRLYVLDGQAVKFTDDLTSTPTWTTVTGTPMETPTAVTSDGFTVWVAYPSGVYSTNTGTGAATSFSTQDADLVSYANGRLLAAHDQVLYELAADGTPSTLFTHPNAQFRWDVLAPSPNALYAAGHAGTVGEGYAVGIEETSTALSSVVSCIALPEGEYITSLLAYVGVIFLGTSRGVRLCSVDAGRNLNYGALVPTPNPVLCLEGDGDFVWFGWSGFGDGSTGLGRMDPSVFTDTLRPAYASDLMVDGTTAVTDVVTFAGDRVFAVAGDGYYAESDELVSTGAINSGLMRWGTTEPKTIHSIDLRTEPLPTGASVEVYLAFDDGEFEGISELTQPHSTGPTEPFSARNEQTEQAEVRLVLNRATATDDGAVVLRATVRALVSPSRSEQIVVPIILHETVDVGPDESVTKRQDTAAEFRFLKGLEAAGQIVTYQEGRESWPVTVEKVALRPRSWTDKQAWLNGLCYVTLRTIS